MYQFWSNHSQKIRNFEGVWVREIKYHTVPPNQVNFDLDLASDSLRQDSANLLYPCFASTVYWTFGTEWMVPWGYPARLQSAKPWYVQQLLQYCWACHMWGISGEKIAQQRSNCWIFKQYQCGTTAASRPDMRFIDFLLKTHRWPGDWPFGLVAFCTTYIKHFF